MKSTDRWREDESPTEKHDRLMRLTLGVAASRVERHPERESFREELLEEALASAWRLFSLSGDSRARIRLDTPGWNPQPGATDLVLWTLGHRHATAVAELKVLDVDQSLWDLLKVISVLEADERLARGFLVVATKPRRWANAEVAALFAPADAACPSGLRQWDVRDLLLRWKRSWTSLLGGGSGRPRDLPARVQTQFLGAHPVPAFPGYELRCIAVEPIETHRRLVLRPDGWPEHAQSEPGLGLRNLLQAREAARTYRTAHPDLRDFHASRAAAMSAALGVNVDGPPPAADPVLVDLLQRVIASIALQRSPFDEYLEMPRHVVELWRRHGRRIDAATTELEHRLLDFAVELVALVWGLDPGTRVPVAELAAHGFDPSTPEPDPAYYV